MGLKEAIWVLSWWTDRVDWDRLPRRGGAIAAWLCLDDSPARRARTAEYDVEFRF